MNPQKIQAGEAPNSVFMCPSERKATYLNASCNYLYNENTGKRKDSGGGTYAGVYYKIQQVKTASKCIWVGEPRNYGEDGSDKVGSSNYSLGFVIYRSYFEHDSPGKSLFADRHSGGGNYLWVTGHVSWHRVFTLGTHNCQKDFGVED